MKTKFYSIFDNLRFRLILLVLLAVIPALGVTYYTGVQQRRLARVKAVDDTYRLTRLVAMYHASMIDNTRQLLAFLSLEKNLRDPQTCNAYLHRLKENYSVYAAFSIAGPEGRLYCSSAGPTGDTSIADREYFQSTLRNRAFSIGPPVTGRLTQKMIIPLSAPLLDQNNNVAAVVVASLDLNQILKYAVSMNLPEQSSILLVDSQGLILFRYPETETWTGQRMPNTPIIQKILSEQGEGFEEAKGVDGIQRLYAFTPLDSNTDNRLFITIGIPSAIAYASANQMLQTNLLWIGIAAVMAIAAAWFFGDMLLIRIVSLTSERDRAEQDLRKANARLETRVAQRTAELDQANQQLQRELGERQRIVEMLRLREVELHNLLHRLEQSNRDLQDFAFITSHDLQEPLRKIQAFGERLIKHHSPGLDDIGRDYAGRMISGANRMQSMINDLLAYSRVSTRGHEYQAVALGEIARQVAADLEVRIHETQGQVIVHDLPTTEADPLQMQQLLQNLVGNALKFHRPGVPPVVHICSEPAPEADPDRENKIQLIINDNGIGFDEKYLGRIFQPFQRLHNRSEYEGSGIGLAICRKIVERHNGTITATSVVGQGSRFIVTLMKTQPK